MGEDTVGKHVGSWRVQVRPCRWCEDLGTCSESRGQALSGWSGAELVGCKEFYPVSVLASEEGVGFRSQRGPGAPQRMWRKWSGWSAEHLREEMETHLCLDGRSHADVARGRGGSGGSRNRTVSVQKNFENVSVSNSSVTL